jgi:3-hydroxybutyrate dehydrogenase
VAFAGDVDILVNNAGIQHVSPVETFPIEKWDAIIAINLSSVFHATRAALPAMKAKKWGRIINVASAHGLVASPFKSAYVAAKHGVVGFTKSCALETAELGITVNTICPGYVLTPLVEKQIDDQAKVHGIPRENVVRDVILAPQPTKQFVTIEQVASMAVFLSSDNAAGMTGTSVSMDGGWTAR